MKSELELAQSLIQAKSPSGQESPATQALLEAFQTLGFDQAYLDDAGNAVGIYDRGEGKELMFNGHLDTVPVGNESLWPHPPLTGTIADNELWGRGSVDMKSAVACMAFAAKDAVEAGFKGRLVVTGVVQEEVGGLGARHLGDTFKPDLIILGEPSNLNMMLGHRGRIEIDVSFPGKIAHAAKNELGHNPLYDVAKFLQQLRSLELPQGGPLGGSSLTPTFLQTFPQNGKNVVPGEAKLIIDYRNIPGDEPEDVLAKLQNLAPEAHFSVGTEHGVAETGKLSMTYPRIAFPYLTPGENSYVQAARPVIKESLTSFGIQFEERCWWFATDAPYLAKSGAPVIGFGPGLEDYAHTTQERVPIEHLTIARKVYSDLAVAFSADSYRSKKP
ncbi:MAG: M20/M25/M40 family metallo-hydrolase [Trueperaceae bacterium]|nr:M20/M25/M40 family metallo-hydrolase [Trueperaceae bacterium]